MTPISFMMTSQQPERRMKPLLRIFMRLQQTLRTQLYMEVIEKKGKVTPAEARNLFVELSYKGLKGER